MQISHSGATGHAAHPVGHRNAPVSPDPRISEQAVLSPDRAASRPLESSESLAWLEHEFNAGLQAQERAHADGDVPGSHILEHAQRRQNKNTVDGLEAYRKNDFERAFHAFSTASIQGDGRAKAMLSVISANRAHAAASKSERRAQLAESRRRAAESAELGDALGLYMHAARPTPKYLLPGLPANRAAFNADQLNRSYELMSAIRVGNTDAMVRFGQALVEQRRYGVSPLLGFDTDDALRLALSAKSRGNRYADRLISDIYRFGSTEHKGTPLRNLGLADSYLANAKKNGIRDDANHVPFSGWNDEWHENTSFLDIDVSSTPRANS